MDQLAKHIAIVGGGTAGWLAAAIFSEAAKRSNLDLHITVIESSKIPTVGVGEGSTAIMRQLFQQLGYDEFEFLKETNATIKFGIRHKDWRRLGHCYDGPIDDPHGVCQVPPNITSSWLNQYCIASGKSVQDTHLFSYLMDKQKSPFAYKEDGSLIAVGPYHHAYHFDQALVAKYLRRKVQGIHLIDALVTGAEKNSQSGNIEKLIFDDERSLSVDFVVDCSGFRRALIVKEMNGKWISYGKKLPVNRAMPFWLDIKPGEEINPFTLAWAQKSGWLWSIPTSQRYGCGYVYCDDFLSPDEAQAEIEEVLGHKIEPRNDIKINAGRLENVWIGNCLAVGLSSSFLEPLEATSIHGTIVQLMLFSQRYLGMANAVTQTHRIDYNKIVAQQVDDFMSFINMHYVSARDDSAFWKTVSSEFILPLNKERLRAWSKRLPQRNDFPNFPENLPHIEEQLFFPVLDGLGLVDRNTAKAELAQNTDLRAHARKTYQTLSKSYKRASTMAIGHRDFLESLQG